MLSFSMGVVAIWASPVAAGKNDKPSAPPSTRMPAANTVAPLPEGDDGDGGSDGSIQESPSAVIGSPDWQCPVVGAKFTNDWGSARSGGRRHEGTDMLAPRGTPILAPVGGVVRFHESGRGGHGFYLAADDGVEYFGVHLDSYAKSGRVVRGDVIGYVGDSGNARGTTHLHFEIHPTKKTKINPYPTLAAYC